MIFFLETLLLVVWGIRGWNSYLVMVVALTPGYSAPLVCLRYIVVAWVCLLFFSESMTAFVSFHVGTVVAGVPLSSGRCLCTLLNLCSSHILRSRREVGARTCDVCSRRR